VTVRLLLTVDARAYGGAEAYVSHLLERLPGTYTCTLLATEPVPRQLENAARARGAALVLVPRVDAKSDIAGQLGLVRAVHSTAPHLVHVNMADTANHRFALGAACLLGKPAVATVHSANPFLPGLQELALGLLFRRLRGTIAVSEEIATLVRDGLGVRSRMVRTVANGVPEATMVDRTNRPAGPVRVAYVGRLTAEKGVDVLLRAVNELVALGLRVEAVIAGEGPERARLERLAEGLPVRFVGFVDDVGALFAEVDVLCLPSRSEGLPFTLLEGMMSGLPCVATAVGGMPAALGHAGVIVPADDVGALAGALGGLIRSANRRMVLGRTAHDRVCARYSLQSMVDATDRAYQEALQG